MSPLICADTFFPALNGAWAYPDFSRRFAHAHAVAQKYKRTVYFFRRNFEPIMHFVAILNPCFFTGRALESPMFLAMDNNIAAV